MNFGGTLFDLVKWGNKSNMATIKLLLGKHVDVLADSPGQQLSLTRHGEYTSEDFDPKSLCNPQSSRLPAKAPGIMEQDSPTMIRPNSWSPQFLSLLKRLFYATSFGVVCYKRINTTAAFE